MRSIVVLALSLLCACSGPAPACSVDEGLRPHVAYYEAELSKAGLSRGWTVLSVKYGDPNPIMAEYADDPDTEYLGVCEIKTNGARFVTIRPNLGWLVTRAVVVHEMEHCAQGLDHVEAEGQIMSAELSLDDNYWYLNWDRLFKVELARLKKEQGRY